MVIWFLTYSAIFTTVSKVVVTGNIINPVQIWNLVVTVWNSNTSVVGNISVKIEANKNMVTLNSILNVYTSTLIGYTKPVEVRVGWRNRNVSSTSV